VLLGSFISSHSKLDFVYTKSPTMAPKSADDNVVFLYKCLQAIPAKASISRKLDFDH
jgi:hypothetical protein